jgi:hypothetical protein
MAFHLNFYHEVQVQKIQQQRDPLKIGLAILVFLAALMILFYLWRMQSPAALAKVASARAAEWSALEPKLNQAKAKETKDSATIAVAEAVLARINNRFFWAPVLQSILENTPDNVQITSAMADSGSEKSEEKISMELTGVIAGREPRIAADEFRLKIEQAFAARYPEATAEFTKLDDRPDNVQLRGESLQTATFAIALKFNRPPAAPKAGETR